MCRMGPPLCGTPAVTWPCFSVATTGRVGERTWEQLRAPEGGRRSAHAALMLEGRLAAEQPPRGCPSELSSRAYEWLLCLWGFEPRPQSHTCPCSWSPIHPSGEKFHTPRVSRAGVGWPAGRLRASSFFTAETCVALSCPSAPSCTLGARALTLTSASVTLNRAIGKRATEDLSHGARRYSGVLPGAGPHGEPELSHACGPEGRVSVGSACSSLGSFSWVSPGVASEGIASRWDFLTRPTGWGHLVDLRQVGPGVSSSTSVPLDPKEGVFVQSHW